MRDPTDAPMSQPPGGDVEMKPEEEIAAARLRTGRRRAGATRQKTW